MSAFLCPATFITLIITINGQFWGKHDNGLIIINETDIVTNYGTNTDIWFDGFSFKSYQSNIVIKFKSEGAAGYDAKAGIGIIPHENVVTDVSNDAITYWTNGSITKNYEIVESAFDYDEGDIIHVAIDFIQNKVLFYFNGGFQASITIKSNTHYNIWISMRYYYVMKYVSDSESVSISSGCPYTLVDDSMPLALNHCNQQTSTISTSGSWSLFCSPSLTGNISDQLNVSSVVSKQFIDDDCMVETVVDSRNERKICDSITDVPIQCDCNKDGLNCSTVTIQQKICSINTVINAAYVLDECIYIGYMTDESSKSQKLSCIDEHLIITRYDSTDCNYNSNRYYYVYINYSWESYTSVCGNYGLYSIDNEYTIIGCNQRTSNPSRVPFNGVQYLGWIVVILYVIYDITKKGVIWCWNKLNKTEEIEKNEDIPYVELGSIEEKNNSIQSDPDFNHVDELDWNGLIRRSGLSVSSEIADIINSCVWFYYFDEFTPQKIYSWVWYVQAVFVIIRISFNVTDLVRTLLLWLNGNVCKSVGCLMAFDSLKYIILSIETIFKFIYSVDVLDNYATFYSLTFSLSLSVKNLLMIPLEYVGKIVELLKNALKIDTDDGCKQQCKKQMIALSGKGLLILFVFMSMNVITFSFYFMGLIWILIYCFIWFVLPILLVLWSALSDNQGNAYMVIVVMVYMIGYYLNIAFGIWFLLQVLTYPTEFSADIGTVWLYGLPTFVIWILYFMLGCSLCAKRCEDYAGSICVFWTLMLLPMIYGLLPTKWSLKFTFFTVLYGFSGCIVECISIPCKECCETNATGYGSAKTIIYGLLLIGWCATVFAGDTMYPWEVF